MCGGRGERLAAPVEKPMLEIGGRPMIAPVLQALDESAVEAVHAAVSPDVPETTTFLADRPVHVIETPGEGYVADLGTALETLDQPVLTVVADLPLLSDTVIDAVLDAHGTGSLTVCIPAVLPRVLGVSVDTIMDHAGQPVAPTGLNIVGATTTGTIHLTYDVRLAVNVNRLPDATIAERMG